jgi:hypothetical protein
MALRSLHIHDNAICVCQNQLAPKEFDEVLSAVMMMKENELLLMMMMMF